jgi:hypothetical protein
MNTEGKIIMGGFARIVATAIIWGALVFIVTLGDVDASNFINLAIILGVAGWVTSEVWQSRDHSTRVEKIPPIVSVPEKSKRSENRRLTRLIDSMSEEDLATLEAVLAARRDQFDEDEQIELNRLLADQERTRR